MESIPRKRRKWKVKVRERRQALKQMLELGEIQDIDVRVALIQALIPEGLKAVNEKLQAEVLALAGEKRQHGKENVRWGSQGGSVYLKDQKVPIMVPRVRNKLRNIEVPLEHYQRFQEPYQSDEQVFKKLLNGLSTHKYRESEEVFPLCGFIHRCHYHKIENVVSYLPKGLQMVWRAKLRAALRQAKYEAALRALEKLSAELHNINPSAEASLKEGLEETLSLHRLGVYAELGKGLSTTNCIESVMAQLGQYTDKVDRWRGGSHIQRWAASGLLALEPRLQKMRGYRYLKLLRAQLQQEITKRQKIQALGSTTSNDLGAGIHITTPENCG
ncbi:MAG: hypothetical protein FJZ13_00065 [Candidatus Omnitrophica bacterium]|nr:hypothetical protein [Candidatus Omnitrophota bacterium]